MAMAMQMFSLEHIDLTMGSQMKGLRLSFMAMAAVWHSIHNNAF